MPSLLDSILQGNSLIPFTNASGGASNIDLQALINSVPEGESRDALIASLSSNLGFNGNTPPVTPAPAPAATPLQSRWTPGANLNQQQLSSIGGNMGNSGTGPGAQYYYGGPPSAPSSVDGIPAEDGGNFPLTNFENGKPFMRKIVNHYAQNDPQLMPKWISTFKKLTLDPNYINKISNGGWQGMGQQQVNPLLVQAQQAGLLGNNQQQGMDPNMQALYNNAQGLSQYNSRNTGIANYFRNGGIG